jgi:FAD/FMN-containing dehydrogenase
MMTTDEARAAFPGGWILPDDTDYDEARSTFNGTIDRRPAVVIRPTTTEEVAAAVRWARGEGLPIAVRGGGHNVAGHATADDAAVIDLRHLREVVVDPERRRVRVGGGAIWNDVDGATVPHGLAMTGGTFGDTGVGGLALGGGLGFLMGTNGLTCDHLVGAEVVTADGSLVIAGDGGDPELLWALRGGGGNFGIVTAFEFALHPLGPLHSGYLTYPIESARDVLEGVAALAAVMPPEMVLFVTGPHLPEDDPTPGGPLTMSVTVVFQGSAEAGDALVAPLRAIGPVDDDIGPKTYLEVQAASGQLPFGLRHYWKGHFVRELDDDVIDTTVRAMASRPGAVSFVLIEAMSGVARQEPAGGAAFGQRGAGWNISGIAIWEDAADDAEQIAWARAYADALLPASLSGAGYANYAPVDETPDRVRASYGPERYARLTAVKRRYDPDNVFRFNLNIRPE